MIYEAAGRAGAAGRITGHPGNTEAHNQLGLTEPLGTSTRLYYTRPYQVLDAGRFAASLSGAITDPLVRHLPPGGTADQIIDSTPALVDLRYPGAVISVR